MQDESDRSSGAPQPHDSIVDVMAAQQKRSVLLIVRPKLEIPREPVPFVHLTRAEFLDRHSALKQDLDAVAHFAHRHHLVSEIDAVDAIAAARRSVVVSGPTKTIESVFPGGARENRGHNYPIPEELREIVVAVIGLYPYVVPSNDNDIVTGNATGHGLDVRRKQLHTVRAMEEFYRFPDGDGEGECIGIIEMAGGYRKKDVDAYFGSLGVSPKIKNRIVKSIEHSGVNNSIENRLMAEFSDWMNGKGAYAAAAKPFFEVTMDVSMIGALAPKAQIQVYFAGDSVRALLCAIQDALFVAEPQPSVLSISWGFQERQILAYESDISAAHQINELFLSAAHMGVTVCCSGGDWGASNQVEDGALEPGYDVQFPASSPYALACGGTTITHDGTEVVWNADFPPTSPKVPKGSYKHGATGGGYSRLFPRPSWQRDLQDSGEGVRKHQRAMPDVAAVADPQCGIRCMLADGTTYPTGGTSAAAPLWAGLIARLNQKLGRRVGCLNPILYANAPHRPGVLNDVTHGDNHFSKHDVGFHATKGWDACTGLGTPVGDALLDMLKKLKPE